MIISWKLCFDFVKNSGLDQNEFTELSTVLLQGAKWISNIFQIYDHPPQFIRHFIKYKDQRSKNKWK